MRNASARRRCWCRAVASTVPPLGERLDGVLGSPIAALVLDLSSLEYISSAGGDL